MDTLQTYSSSSSEAEEQLENYLSHSVTKVAANRASSTGTSELPPPDALEAISVNSGSRKQLTEIPISLPAVTPVQEKVDKYLVHVFLPLDHPLLSSFARSLLAQARLTMVGKPIKAALTTLTDFHISISRPAVIQSAQIHTLVKQLRKAISLRPRGEVVIQKKPVSFHSKNQRRLFLAAPVATDAPEQDDFTISLIRLVSNIFEENGLPRFFDDPRPHMSFAWTETVDASYLFSEAGFEDNKEGSLTLHVEKVLCTIGKSKYCFPLK